MLILGVPTLNRYADCVNMIESAYMGTKIPDITIVVDNGGSFTDYISDLDVDCISVIVPQDNQGNPINIGCACAWNIISSQMTFDDVCLVVNDDVTFTETTIQDLYQGYLDNPNELVYVSEGSGINAFSMFLITPKAIQEVGYFDENFTYPYLEDNDYHYRLTIAGYDLTRVPCQIASHVGSATLKAYTPEQMEQHHRNFRKNEEYYVSKYGGLPHHELFLDRYKELSDRLLKQVARNEVTPVAALKRLQGILRDDG